MDGFKWSIIIGVLRKLALPALFGAAVLWLTAHHLDSWANVVCAIGDALYITVEECK